MKITNFSNELLLKIIDAHLQPFATFGNFVISVTSNDTFLDILLELLLEHPRGASRITYPNELRMLPNNPQIKPSAMTSRQAAPVPPDHLNEYCDRAWIRVKKYIWNSFLLFLSVKEICPMTSSSSPSASSSTGPREPWPPSREKPRELLASFGR